MKESGELLLVEGHAMRLMGFRGALDEPRPAREVTDEGELGDVGQARQRRCGKHG